MLLKPNSRICMNMPFCTQKRLLFFIWTQLTQIKTCDLAGLGLMHHAQVRGFHYRRGTAVQVGHFSWNAKGPIGVFAVHAETYGAIAVFYLWFDGNVGWLRAEVKTVPCGRILQFFVVLCVWEAQRWRKHILHLIPPTFWFKHGKTWKNLLQGWWNSDSLHRGLVRTVSRCTEMMPSRFANQLVLIWRKNIPTALVHLKLGGCRFLGRVNAHCGCIFCA